MFIRFAVSAEEVDSGLGDGVGLASTYFGGRFPWKGLDLVVNTKYPPTAAASKKTINIGVKPDCLINI